MLSILVDLGILEVMSDAERSKRNHDAPARVFDEGQ